MLTDKVLFYPSSLVSGERYLGAYLKGVSVWRPLPYAASQILFVASGVVWSRALRPIRCGKLALAEALGAEHAVPAEYGALTRKWFRWGLSRWRSRSGRCSRWSYTVTRRCCGGPTW